MRKEHLHTTVPAPRSSRGEIPPDLARPRDPNRASLIVNVAAASILGVCTLVMLAYALLVVPW